MNQSMTDNQKAASILRQYAGEIYQGHTIGGEWPEESAHIEREHDELIALADRLALADAGEPVAWGIRPSADSRWHVVESEKLADMARERGLEVSPIYTHPAPGRVGEQERARFLSAYAKACESSDAADWYNAAMLAKQWDCAIAASREREGRMREALEKLQPLARRTLWLAYVWNDHNFTHPLAIARSEAKRQGFNCLEDAQEFLADLSKDMAFDFALKPQPTTEKEQTK